MLYLKYTSLVLCLAIISVPVITLAQSKVYPPNYYPASRVNWENEDSYWSQNFSERSYSANMNYSFIQPAYKYGVDIYEIYGGVRFEELNQAEIEDNWNFIRGSSNMDWMTAKKAAQDSYERLYYARNPNAIPKSGLNETVPASGSR